MPSEAAIVLLSGTCRSMDVYSVTMVTAALDTQHGSQCLRQYCYCIRLSKAGTLEFMPVTRCNPTHPLPLMLQSIYNSYVRSTQREHPSTQRRRWIQTNRFRYACSD